MVLLDSERWNRRQSRSDRFGIQTLSSLRHKVCAPFGCIFLMNLKEKGFGAGERNFRERTKAERNAKPTMIELAQSTTILTKLRPGHALGLADTEVLDHRFYFPS